MRAFAQAENLARKRASLSITKSSTLPPAASHQAHFILHLQRTIGNQAVQRLLQAEPDDLEARSSINEVTRSTHDLSQIPVHPKSLASLQAKLTVSSPGDSYEQEADRVSEQVMRMPEPQLKRDCPCGGGCSKCQSEHASDGISKTNASHKSHAVEAMAAPIGHEALRPSDRPLDPSTRAFMESRLGHSFADVRMHADRDAANAARTLNARAFTIGRDVFFGAGQFSPGSPQTRATLAHELVHVIQQQSRAAPMIARQSLGEMWGALWGAGPVDSYRASKLADEALKAAQQTGLPGLHNGPADAWRHCYWNCRMVQVIGKEDAADIAENHEEHGGNSTAERMMDTWNNEEGRECSGNCDTCCQSKLDAGDLWILEGGKVGASKPTVRPGTPSGGKYDKY